MRTYIADFDAEEFEISGRTFLLPKGLAQAHKTPDGELEEYQDPVWSDNGVPTLFYSYKDGATPVMFDAKGVPLNRDPAVITAYAMMIKARAEAGSFFEMQKKMFYLLIAAVGASLIGAYFGYQNQQSFNSLPDTITKAVVGGLKTILPSVIK
jgi:hypothetical protein